MWNYCRVANYLWIWRVPYRWISDSLDALVFVFGAQGNVLLLEMFYCWIPFFAWLDKKALI
jgi:hypothetical protein